MKKNFLFLLITGLTSFLFALPAMAEQRSATDITSDKMTYAGQENIVIFSGNVHVVRPDFELWSNELHVFLKPDQDSGQAGDDQQDNIEKIIAKGDVLIKSENREGRSQTLTYHPDHETARLEGNPVLLENQNSVEGEVIILNMQDNTSEVLSGPSRRVRVIFHSGSDNDE
ncbi:LptA/OstA family protein [Desulfonatronovibrio hydrogenovorans]|uniref:LptA/OstA family protein n=1 Tax=Desulfonatronovibrio hydrogenovorans TaxID=53245 RepID=UPI000491DE25|nr:LptA/OstA family protein [Desulfonatronovibrio hydrogenovorans]